MQFNSSLMFDLEKSVKEEFDCNILLCKKHICASQFHKSRVRDNAFANRQRFF